MLKLTSVVLIFVMFQTVGINGQTLPDLPKPRQSRSDLREVFSKETAKIKNESAAIDTKKMNKSQRQVMRNNWSKTKTALVVVLAVVVVGALYVIVKNTRRCVERYPPGCSFVDDLDCECVRSER